MDFQVVWAESVQEDLKQLVSFKAADDPVSVERFGLGLVDHVEQASLFRMFIGCFQYFYTV